MREKIVLDAHGGVNVFGIDTGQRRLRWRNKRFAGAGKRRHQAQRQGRE